MDIVMAQTAKDSETQFCKEAAAQIIPATLEPTS